MNTEELTQIANVHQSVLTRHDQEVAGIRTLLSLSAAQHRDDLATIRTVLNQISQQQASNTQAIAQLTAEQQLSRQDLNSLTASIRELRGVVADYIQTRSETE
jgi:phytoene/squalene synthetase